MSSPLASVSQISTDADGEELGNNISCYVVKALVII
jgi:hypothetical protein